MQYQITSQEIKTADDRLDKKLLNFVSLYGVQVKEIDNFKEKFEIDALAVTDTLNKIIYYSVNKKLDTISEEVSHVVVMLMGQENTLINDLINNIKDWSKYQDIYNEYILIYNNEKQVKIEAIGKLIAECLIENWEHRIKKENNIIKAVANTIAINILNENQDFIDPNVYKIRKLNYEEAVSGNKLAEDIINKFTSKDYNYKLAGSLAIAGQGETVYRYSKAPVNDLDFIVDNIEEYERINATMLSMNAVQIHDGLTNFQKKTKFYSYLVPGLGYTFKNLIRDDKNWLKEYSIINSKSHFIATIQHNTATESVYTKEDGSNLSQEEIDNLSQYNLPVDFYIYTVKSDEQPVGIFSSIQDMYFGKLTQSPNGINERMFQRKKDQWDYRFSNFINRNIEKKEFLYF
jgi:hypothetical protein